jgi:hypothetical protein
MYWEELRVMARRQVREARAVLAAYPHEEGLGAVLLTDPGRSAQSFSSRFDELSWFDLIIFHRTIRLARNRDVDAFCELPRQLRTIEREFNLA